MLLLLGQTSMSKRLLELLFSSVFFFKCEIFKGTEILVRYVLIVFIQRLVAYLDL